MITIAHTSTELTVRWSHMLTNKEDEEKQHFFINSF